MFHEKGAYARSVIDLMRYFSLMDDVCFAFSFSIQKRASENAGIGSFIKYTALSIQQLSTVSCLNCTIVKYG